MFFYLSFLKPPPVAVAADARDIVITPQIANDLRTELKNDGPTDIFFSWQRMSPSSPPLPFQKLTTYHPPRTTYTPVTVTLPKLRPNESWRLGLSTDPSGRTQSFPLDGTRAVSVWSEPIRIEPAQKDDSSGPPPNKRRKGERSSVSHSTSVVKSKQNQGEKQTRIWREWALSGGVDGIGGNQRPEEGEHVLRIVEQTGFDLDKKIWDSGLALSSHIHACLNPHDPSSEVRPPPDSQLGKILDILTPTPASSPEGSPRKIRVLELGAGTGLVSISLAASLRLAKRRRRGQATLSDVAGGSGSEDGVKKSGTSECRPAGRSYEIMTTDLGSALPLIEENMLVNRHLWDDPKASDREIEGGAETLQDLISVLPSVLDWDDPVPSWVWDDGRELDLVIAADVTYNTASFPSLLRTLLALLRPRTDTTHPSTSSHLGPRLLLAYKQRDPAERELWDLLKDGGVRMREVGRLKGYEGEGEEGGVELWMGQMDV